MRDLFHALGVADPRVLGGVPHASCFPLPQRPLPPRRPAAPALSPMLMPCRVHVWLYATLALPPLETDDVIDPAESRQWIVSALEAAEQHTQPSNRPCVSPW